MQHSNVFLKKKSIINPLSYVRIFTGNMIKKMMKIQKRKKKILNDAASSFHVDIVFDGN